MTHPSGIRKVASFAIAVLLLAACANQREPAQKMMNDIEAIAERCGSAEAAKYAPDEFNNVQTKLDDLKNGVRCGQDYRGVPTQGTGALERSPRPARERRPPRRRR